MHFFHLFPQGLAESLRSDCFFAGAFFFARMTLPRSAFRGFQIGFKTCKCEAPRGYVDVAYTNACFEDARATFRAARTAGQSASERSQAEAVPPKANP